MLNALIFDVDGTLADTESVHLEAFNHAFRQEGLDWHWSTEQYTQLLDISGGKERMLHHWRTVDPDMKEVDAGALTDTINRLHEIKTAFYENAVNHGAVLLRPPYPWLIVAATLAALGLLRDGLCQRFGAVAEEGAAVAEAEVAVAQAVSAEQRGALRALDRQRGGARPVAHPVQRHAEQVVGARGFGLGHGARVGGDEALGFGPVERCEALRRNGGGVHAVTLRRGVRSAQVQ